MNPTATAEGEGSFEARSGLLGPDGLCASRSLVNALCMGSPPRAFAAPIPFRSCRGIHPAVRLGGPAREPRFNDSGRTVEAHHRCATAHTASECATSSPAHEPCRDLPPRVPSVRRVLSRRGWLGAPRRGRRHADRGKPRAARSRRGHRARRARRSQSSHAARRLCCAARRKRADNVRGVRRASDRVSRARTRLQGVPRRDREGRVCYHRRLSRCYSSHRSHARCVGPRDGMGRTRPWG